MLQGRVSNCTITAYNTVYLHGPNSDTSIIENSLISTGPISGVGITQQQCNLIIDKVNFTDSYVVTAQIAASTAYFTVVRSLISLF